MGERSFKILRELVIWATVLLSVSALSVGQNAPAPQLANASSDGGDDLQAQIRALQISVARMQSRIDSMQGKRKNSARNSAIHGPDYLLSISPPSPHRGPHPAPVLRRFMNLPNPMSWLRPTTISRIGCQTWRKNSNF